MITTAITIIAIMIIAVKMMQVEEKMTVMETMMVV